MALTLMRLENGITEGVRGNWSGASSGILRATRVALACFFFLRPPMNRSTGVVRVIGLFSCFFLNGLSGFTEFYRVLPGFLPDLPGLPGSTRVSLGFLKDLLGFTGFY